MTEQHVKARYLTKDVILGWVSFGIIVAMAIFSFQLIQNRNSSEFPEQIPRISPSDLKRESDADANVLVVDVRSSEEYEQMHIVGAISIPLEEINQRYNELKGYKQVVTYCT